MSRIRWYYGRSGKDTLISKELSVGAGRAVNKQHCDVHKQATTKLQGLCNLGSNRHSIPLLLIDTLPMVLLSS